MQIQVITFRLERMSPAQFDRYGQSFELAVRDTPGFVTTVCLEGQVENARGGVIVWEDAPAMAAFRHSELYARLAMSPFVEDFQDKDMSVVPQTDFELMLAA